MMIAVLSLAALITLAASEITKEEFFTRLEDRRLARRYEQLTTDTIKFIGEVERVVKAPVSLISTRLDFRSILDRRRW
jgi:adenylosuccinate synthase